MPTITETLFTAWNFRHACKEFDPQFTINAEDFHTILEAGRLSPSSFGFEPWEFLVIQNPALREELRAICWGAQGQLPTASHFIIFLARQPKSTAPKCAYLQNTIMRDTQHLPDDIITARTKKFEEFIEKDLGYHGNDRAKFEWAARQCYIALGNMLTTAALLGIDSCPIEGFQKEHVEALLTKKELMDCSIFGVACMAAFGKRIVEPRPKTRRESVDVVRWVR